MPARHRILVCGGVRWAGETARRLQRACASASVVVSRDPSVAAATLRQRRPDVVVLTSESDRPLTATCQEARRLFGAHTTVMVVTPVGGRSTGIACLRQEADSLHVGLTRGEELVARVEALLRGKRRRDALHRRGRRLEREHRRMVRLHQRLDEDLALAQKLQRSFLPSELPALGAVRFAVRLLAVGPVAGDIYDVVRLDERTVGFYVADAVGHGVAAALLTAFVKKAIRPKITSGHRYRILPPGEVLTHLNREMLTEELHESSFVTMAYGTIDVETHVLKYSLAGHPPGILLGSDGRRELLDHGGPLLGVMDEAFQTQTVSLVPGDKLVFYSDGIDEARHRSGEAGARALMLGAAQHAALPVDGLLDTTLRHILPDPNRRRLRDDLTLMALEIIREEQRKRA